MKKLILFLILISIALVGFACSKGVEDGPAIDFSPAQKSGDIEAFALESPVNDAVFTSVPTFRWESAPNADSYILEICTSPEFVFTTIEGDVYVKQIYIKKAGLMNTEFDLVANLKKNTKYYWRVTAANSNRKQTCSDGYLSFTYNALETEEIPLSVGYADEWKVHEVGSKATVALDRSGFFEEGEDALRVSFDREDTQRGEAYVESNGWIVLTRSLETEFYGVDAFYFNFYYSGNDAAAYFRLIDEDNEYWYAPIKLAMNAKQTCIIRFDEFVLRTNGTPVMNMTFDYNYLKSVELVFERVDGDGVAYFGDLRAIRYENYKDMFIESLDFSKLEYTFDNYNFGLTVSEDSTDLTYSFSGQANDTNAKGIQGYGFVKFPIGKILAKGDAFEFTLDFTSVANFRNANFLFRLVEEDGDRWKFKIRVSDVPEDGKILLPFTAFVLDEFRGDGLRQFAYIKEMQLGINDNYSGGAITVKDFSVVSLSDTFEDELYTVTVQENGLIESFESYDPSYEVYYKWETSAVNKDESIEVYTESALGAKNHAAKFGYKTDLPAASYHVSFEPVKDFTAIKISAKDVSVSGADATMIVYLHGSVGELYSYTIEKLADDWTSYTIPISEFALDENSSGQFRVSIERVVGVSIAFQYFYKKKSIFDFSDPAQYNSGGYVAVDNITFTNAEEYATEEVSGKIKPSEANKQIAVISDFDKDDAFVYWDVNKSAVSGSDLAPNASVSYSTETASGQGRSLKMDYKSQMVAPFYADIVVDSSVTAKGVDLLFKGDGRTPKAEIILYANDKAYIYRIDEVADGWNTYKIGFSNFLSNDGKNTLFSASDVSKITRVAIYLKNSKGNYIASSVYLDEICFDNTIAITTNTVTAYQA